MKYPDISSSMWTRFKRYLLPSFYIENNLELWSSLLLNVLIFAGGDAYGMIGLKVLGYILLLSIIFLVVAMIHAWVEMSRHKKKKRSNPAGSELKIIPIDQPTAQPTDDKINSKKQVEVLKLKPLESKPNKGEEVETAVQRRKGESNQEEDDSLDHTELETGGLLLRVGSRSLVLISECMEGSIKKDYKRSVVAFTIFHDIFTACLLVPGSFLCRSQLVIYCVQEAMLLGVLMHYRIFEDTLQHARQLAVECCYLLISLLLVANMLGFVRTEDCARGLLLFSALILFLDAVFVSLKCIAALVRGLRVQSSATEASDSSDKKLLLVDSMAVTAPNLIYPQSNTATTAQGPATTKQLIEEKLSESILPKEKPSLLKARKVLPMKLKRRLPKVVT